MMDQIGQLIDQVGLVMLGLMPSGEFVNNFSDVASIDRTKATSIAEDINAQIFDKLRSAMRTMQGEIQTESETQSQNKAISSIERAGNFEIEKVGGDVAGGGGGAAGETPDVTEKDRDTILSEVENPRSGADSGTERVMSEPLVDQLLAGPTARPEEKVDVTPAKPAPKPPASTPSKPAGADPYREPI
ncbi:MAG: hypothetical protein KGI49_03380 [Patescibacteria group bacterium]|nr:hypothetical protein [Patescibacteria group bacterium]